MHETCASGNKTSVIKFEKSSFFPDNSGVRAEKWTVEKEKSITRLLFSSWQNKFKKVAHMVWPPIGNIKFETLSYLPPLTKEQLSKEVDYLIRKGWVPCLEFETEKPFIYREHASSPGYYDGRYWTMWKLPMFGCTDSSQVLKEVDECVKEYKNAFVRIIGFDNVRQVQCISFIAHKPASY